MQFGQRVRELRNSKNLSQRALGERIGVSFTYVSKIENGKLDFGDYPSEALIHRMAEALDADEDELLILAEKIPERIRQRVFERPDAFRVLADVDDSTLDALIVQVGNGSKARSRRKKGRSHG